jgi:hypothetical protein
VLYGTRIALAGECPSWTLWIPLPVRTGRPDCQPPSLWHRPCFSPSATTARNAGEPHCEASCAGRRRSLRSLLLSAHWHCCRSALRWTLRPGTEVPPPFGFGVGGATPPLPIGSLGAAYRSTTPNILNMEHVQDFWLLAVCLWLPPPHSSPVGGSRNMESFGSKS